MPPPVINVNYAVAKRLIGIRECSLFMEGVSEIMGGLTSFRCFKGFAQRRGRKSYASFKLENYYIPRRTLIKTNQLR